MKTVQKSFTYYRYGELINDVEKLQSIVKNAAVLKTVKGMEVQVGEFVISKKAGKVLYYVMEIKNANKPDRVAILDPLINKDGSTAKRGTDTIAGAFLKDDYMVLDVRRENP